MGVTNMNKHVRITNKSSIRTVAEKLNRTMKVVCKVDSLKLLMSSDEIMCVQHSALPSAKLLIA